MFPAVHGNTRCRPHTHTHKIINTQNTQNTHCKHTYIHNTQKHIATHAHRRAPAHMPALHVRAAVHAWAYAATTDIVAGCSFVHANTIAGSALCQVFPFSSASMRGPCAKGLGLYDKARTYRRAL